MSIDCSTTATKVIVWNRYGQAMAEGWATYPRHQPQPDWHEQDAEDW